MNKDDFWSVDRLLPRVHSSFSPARPASTGVPLATLDDAVPNKSFGEIIRPQGSRVIRFYRLTKAIFPKNDLILQANGDQSPQAFVPCSLYAPTILNLNAAQRNYFFYFCQKVEERQKVETSFAYLRLYLCRLVRQIEICEKIPEEVFWLWSTYREQFPLADKLFADFVSDFCFYKGITPPYDSLGEILTKKNFFTRPFLLDPFIFDYLFAPDRKLTSVEIDYLLRTLTNQSFRKSKAYKVNSRFAAASEEAVHRAFSDGLFNRKELNESLFRIQIPSEVHTVRPLFQGLIPEEVPQVEINLCYLPLLHDENIRYRCDEIVRYLENRIRGILKIKNSLSRIHIGNEHKAFLEAILLEFQHLSPLPEDKEIPQEISRTQKMRELSIDPKEANKIEEESWEITQKLTESYLDAGGDSITIGSDKDESFDKQYESALKQVERAPIPAEQNEFWEFASLLSEEEDTFLRHSVNEGKDAARKFTSSMGAFFEAMVASCNEKAMDSIGDAVMDPAGQIFDEYRSDLEEVFPAMKGDQP